jgi:hypothetical protein
MAAWHTDNQQQRRHKSKGSERVAPVLLRIVMVGPVLVRCAGWQQRLRFIPQHHNLQHSRGGEEESCESRRGVS